MPLVVVNYEPKDPEYHGVVDDHDHLSVDDHGDPPTDEYNRLPKNNNFSGADVGVRACFDQQRETPLLHKWFNINSHPAREQVKKVKDEKIL